MPATGGPFLSTVCFLCRAPRFSPKSMPSSAIGSKVCQAAYGQGVDRYSWRTAMCLGARPVLFSCKGPSGLLYMIRNTSPRSCRESGLHYLFFTTWLIRRVCTGSRGPFSSRPRTFPFCLLLSRPTSTPESTGRCRRRVSNSVGGRRALQVYRSGPRQGSEWAFGVFQMSLGRDLCSDIVRIQLAMPKNVCFRFCRGY